MRGISLILVMMEILSRRLSFRQHEGTLDGTRVVNWIKLVLGIVQRLESIAPESMGELFAVARHEKWGKTADLAENRANEPKYGPVLAEGAFTMVDLLNWLGLQEQADYYRDRLFPISGFH